jgi:AMP nucleosidase
MKDLMKISPIKGEKTEDMNQRIDDLLTYMEEVDNGGYYPQLTVIRTWSEHNPRISGEFAKPRVFNWYLSREIRRLLQKGAEVEVKPSRKKIALNDPVLLDNLDEDIWDFTQKKLFLFKAERIDISIDRLQHYTGTAAEDFQRYILFTNYDMHVEVFKQKFPDCVQPSRVGVQMPAYHHKLDDNLGVTLVNIGVGPSNAKTCTDHVAVLRPDVMIMVGHCGGLRNHQEIGDFVLASGYMRSDGVFDEILPKSVPLTPNYLLNIHLQNALEKYALNYRLGTVYTTDNRNWEFVKKRTVEEINMSRSIAIDMESATVATNGFRYRVPNATLLCVSDKPLHGKPKLFGAAQNFYQNSKEKHLEVVLAAIEEIKKANPSGLPNDSLRAADEPLMGGI